MKNISKLFTKTSPTSATNKNTSVRGGAPQFHIDKGIRLTSFLPRSRTSIMLVVGLFVALGLFVYQNFNSAHDPLSSPMETAAIATKALPKTMPVEDKNTISTAQKLFAEKQFGESAAMYLNLLKSKPNDAQVLNDLGLLYLKQRKLEDSEEQLKRSLALNPNCFTCLNNLGYLKTLQGQASAAESYLERAIRLSPDYLDPYFNLGVLYEKNGDFANSANAYREFIRRSKDPESSFNLKLKQHIFSMLDK